MSFSKSDHQPRKRTAKDHLLQSNLDSFLFSQRLALTADATPANPKKGAKGGQRDMDSSEDLTARVY
jgi:hypothetical protein